MSDPTPDGATVEPAANEGRATVVVANTDEIVCEVLARIIERSGHEVVRITDTEQVGTAVLSAGADAVVLDLGAANVDQLRSLRAGGSQRGVDVRAIAISTGPANALLVWQVDADAVLTRPFAATSLEEELAAALDRSDADRRILRDEQMVALS